MTEIWKSHPLHDIEVSSEGRIRGLNPFITAHGYKTIRVGRKNTRYVHRLVLETFVGEPPRSNTRVRFRNGQRKDCRLENLYWEIAKPRVRSRKREHPHPNAKLTPNQVLEMRRLRIEAGLTVREIAERFDVSTCCASNTTRGLNYKQCGGPIYNQ